MTTIKDQIIARIKSGKQGSVFCVKDFCDLASRNTIDKNIARLVDDGLLAKIDWGLYHYPIIQKDIGVIPPSVDDIANALSRSLGVLILPSGAACANLLGLSTQVPAQNIYLTNGRSFKKKIGNFDIQFKHSKIACLGDKADNITMIVAALNYLGKNNISDVILKKCASYIKPIDKGNLLKITRNLSAWMFDVARKLDTI